MKKLKLQKNYMNWENSIIGDLFQEKSKYYWQWHGNSYFLEPLTFFREGKMKKRAFLFLAVAAVLLAATCNKAVLEQTAPQTAEDYQARESEYLNTIDYDRAIKDFTQAINLNPNDAEAYNNRGNVYSNRDHDYAEKGDDFFRAIADYNQAIHLNPNYAEAYNNRGKTFANNKRYGGMFILGFTDLAIADYTQAISLNPNYAEAYKNRGDAYVFQSDYDKAIADYETALQLESNDNVIKLRLVNALRARRLLPPQGIEGPPPPALKHKLPPELPQQDEEFLLLRGPWITYCELHLEEMHREIVEIIHSNVPNYLGIEYDESMRNSFRNSNEPVYSELIVENSFEKYICEVCNKIRDEYMESIRRGGKK
jgi:tetratricopeptide (TPR) repeat protein